MELYKGSQRVLGHILEEKARLNKDKIYLRFVQQRISFEELNDRANRVANTLTRLGIKKGDQIGIMLPNCPEYLYLWFGASKVGAVEVPINVFYRGSFLSRLLQHSEVKILAIDSSNLEKLYAVEKDLSNLQTVVICDSPGDPGRTSFFPESKFEAIPFLELLTGSSDPPIVQMEPKDLMAIMYTSGTTGLSKGIMISHNFGLHFAEDCVQYQRYGPQTVIYNCLPLFHANAQFLTALPCLLIDGCYAMGERFSASNFWEEVRGHGATAFNFIGAMIDILMKIPPSSKDREHSVCLIRGVPITPIVRQFMERHGIPVVIHPYGLAETGTLTFLPYGDPNILSCGKPAEDFEVMLVDENDQEVAVDEIGEFAIRSKKPYTIMSGYWKMPEETLEAFRNLWFHTGDLGRKDEKGYFYFVDRKKDAIRRRGENISSSEVEAVVNSHPKVLESAAIGVRSEFAEDEVKIVVQLRDGETLDPRDLLDYCNEQMPYFMVPRYVEFVDSLPKTPSNKVQKYLLREQGVTPQTWDREKAGYKIKR